MAATRLFVFAYDVSHDRRRARVAALLENNAARVQESVFEALLTPAAGQALTAHVKRLLEPNDRLRVYSLPSREIPAVVCHGGPPVQELADYWLL